MDAEVKLAQAMANIQNLEQGLNEAITLAEQFKKENEKLKTEVALKARIAELDYDVEIKKLALDEQKLIAENLKAGLTHQATMAKAYAEIKKADDQTAISAIRAMSELNETMKPMEIAKEYEKEDNQADSDGK